MTTCKGDDRNLPHVLFRHDTLWHPRTLPRRGIGDLVPLARVRGLLPGIAPMSGRSRSEHARDELVRLLRKVEQLGVKVRQQQVVIERLARLATGVRRGSRRTG